MDKWTWVGFVITAAIAFVVFVLVKYLLNFIVDHWLWILLGLIAAGVIGLALFGRSAKK